MKATTHDLNEVTARAGQDLLALKHSRLFLTGGTGYIGRWLLEALCHANKELCLGMTMTVLSRNPERFFAECPHLANDPAVNLVVGDVRDFVWPDGGYSHVVHAATDVVAVNSPLETFDVTVSGTRRVLDFASARGVGDVLLLSSGAVYGPIPHDVERVAEDFRGAPAIDADASAYGVGKLVTEWLGNVYASQGHFSCKSARVFAQVGPYLALDKQFAAGNFIRDALRGDPFVIRGDGTPLRSYMYATDLVIWLLALLVRGKTRRAYNVGSDLPISISGLARTIADLAGIVNPRIEIHGVHAPGDPVERYVPDTSRARHELGLQIEVPLDVALQRTVDWHRAIFLR